MMICKICEREFKNSHALAAHVRQKHKIQTKDYYDLYLKKEHEGKCVVCSNDTTYQHFGSGYLPTCSHICGGTYFRRELKNDTTRFSKFKDAVSINQKRIWKERVDDDINYLKSLENKNGNKI